jgi:hypothetical protein
LDSPLATLHAQAEHAGISLDFHPPAADRTGSSLIHQSPRGSFQVTAHPGDSFFITVWLPGVQVGHGGTRDIARLVSAMKGWQDGVGLRRLLEDWPDMPLLPTAVAHEEGFAVEATWQAMLAGDQRIRRGNLHLLEAAYAQPRLRTLFPFPSHGTLAFLRATRFPLGPQTEPFIAQTDGAYLVYAPAYARLIGESATADQAAQLTVEHLSADCGPAIEGSWPAD